MSRTTSRTLAVLAPLLPLLPVLAAAGPTQAGDHDDHDDPDRHGRPPVHLLTGDPGGSRFEGIGVDERRDTFYVSEVTGGEIHRGSARSPQTEEWLAGDGTDGRFTARGITTDRAGRVYVAGGPNGIGTSRPDLWVYDRAGTLLAALRAPAENVFLNDVWIGPDGAAYLTNSNAPQVFRLHEGPAGFEVELWADATGTVPTAAGFNLGGIVTSPDRSALVVAQGNAGRLWRFDLDDRSVRPVAVDGADLVDADGLVLRGRTLTVVRNFARVVTTLRLSPDGSAARLVVARPSDPTRVLTTAKVLAGRMLFVDSKFDEPVAAPPYEVVTDPFGDAAGRWDR